MYKTFSENVMTHGDKVTSSLRFDSNERKEANYKQPFIKQLNEIEKLIHPRYKRPLVHNSMEKPEYDIENVDIEKFNVDIVVNDKLAKEYEQKEKQENKYEYPSQIENFSGLISHINSDFNDLNDDLPSTKLVPVNDRAISKALTNTRLYPTKHRGKSNLDEIFGVADGTVVQIDNDIQDTPIPNDNMVPANVIVL